MFRSTPQPSGGQEVKVISVQHHIDRSKSQKLDIGLRRKHGFSLNFYQLKPLERVNLSIRMENRKEAQSFITAADEVLWRDYEFRAGYFTNAYFQAYDRGVWKKNRQKVHFQISQLEGKQRKQWVRLTLGVEEGPNIRVLVQFNFRWSELRGLLRAITLYFI